MKHFPSLLLLAAVLSAGDEPSADLSRLDPVLQRTAASAEPSAPVRLLVRLRPGAPVPAIPGLTATRTGNILSVRAPASALPLLAAHPDVVRAEASRPVRLHTDVSNASSLGVRGTISVPAETDSYTLQGTAGETVQIVAVSEDGSVDTMLTVTDPPAAPVVATGGGPGTDAAVSVTWASTGAKTVDVTEEGGTTGDYVLFVTSDRQLSAGDLSGGSFYAGSAAREARAVHGVDGTGVVIGFVDSGIDFTHADFLDASGGTRLISIWDQTLTPISGESSPGGFAYGVEYTQAQIDADLSGATPGFVRQQDTVGHGTHVAGIAAGDDPVFTGAAPGARLIMVKFDGSTTGVVDGLNYILEQATGPWVINLSLGSHDGPHDGTGLLDQAVSAVADRGQVVVISAGNEGNEDRHARSAIASGVSDSWEFTPGTGEIRLSGVSDGHLIDVWADGDDQYSVTVTDGSTSLTVASGASNSVINALLDGVQIDNRTDSPSNGATHIRIEIFNLDADPWTVTLQRTADDGNGVVDGWVGSEGAVVAGPSGTFTDAGDLVPNADGSIPGTVAEPGTAVDALTVGAYRTKFAWDNAVPGTTRKTDGVGAGVAGALTDFSSRGPTRDGRMKPDISAPGAYLGSARSADSGPAADDDDADGVHTYMQGTSMSAPVVAGILALLFQKNNVNNAAEIRSLFSQTALLDGFVTAGNGWGYGKVDPSAMIAAVPVQMDVKAEALCSAGAPADAGNVAALAALVLLLLLAVRRMP